MNDQKRGHGALPPQGQAWQRGKTAASMRFVSEAQLLLAGSTLTEQQKEDLACFIEQIKGGEKILMDWISPEDYLAGLSG